MAKKSKVKVPVSTRAVIARINRNLAKKGELLYKARVPTSGHSVDYYVVDTRKSNVAGEVYDLETFARECGVLRPWEALQS